MIIPCVDYGIQFQTFNDPEEEAFRKLCTMAKNLAFDLYLKIVTVHNPERGGF